MMMNDDHDNNKENHLKDNQDKDNQKKYDHKRLPLYLTFPPVKIPAPSGFHLFLTLVLYSVPIMKITKRCPKVLLEI